MNALSVECTWQHTSGLHSRCAIISVQRKGPNRQGQHARLQCLGVVSGRVRDVVLRPSRGHAVLADLLCAVRALGHY